MPTQMLSRALFAIILADYRDVLVWGPDGLILKPTIALHHGGIF